jgi:hypothetical protein
MKKSSLTALAIPEQAKIIQETSNDANYSKTYDIQTGTIVKWSSAVVVTGYPAGIMSFINGGPWPWLALGFGIASAVSGFFTLGAMFIDGSERRMRNNLRKISNPVVPGEWTSQKTKPNNTYSGIPYRGIKISHRSRRTLFSAYWHPLRPFRKILLAETIWYEPTGDYFTRVSNYLGFFNWVETTQVYAGRRRTFGQTLNSLKAKPQESLSEKVEEKS